MRAAKEHELGIALQQLLQRVLRQIEHNLQRRLFSRAESDRGRAHALSIALLKIEQLPRRKRQAVIILGQQLELRKDAPVVSAYL